MKKRSIDTFDPCALVVRNIFLARTPSRCTYNRKSAVKQVFPLPNNKGLLLFPIIFNCPAMSAGAVTTATAGTCNAMFLSLSVILLLVTLISAIIILSFFLVHCRRKLNSTRESLVRYINIPQCEGFCALRQTPRREQDEGPCHFRRIYPNHK